MRYPLVEQGGAKFYSDKSMPVCNVLKYTTSVSSAEDISYADPRSFIFSSDEWVVTLRAVCLPIVRCVIDAIARSLRVQLS